MAFSPLDFLAAIITAFLSAYGRRFDRLAIDAAGAGRRLLALLFPHLFASGIQEPLPSAIVLPLAGIAEDGTLGKQVVRQQFPLAACFVLIAQRIDHFPHIDLPWPASMLGRRNQSPKPGPLVVCQIRFVWLTHTCSLV